MRRPSFMALQNPPSADRGGKDIKGVPRSVAHDLSPSAADGADRAHSARPCSSGAAAELPPGGGRLSIKPSHQSAFEKRRPMSGKLRREEVEPSVDLNRVLRSIVTIQ